MNSPVESLETALLAVDRISAARIVHDACIHHTSVQCLETLVVPALENIGRKWESGTVALSQIYMSGRICEELVDRMLPDGDPNRVIQPKIAIGVLEDHHTLGKRIVFSVLRAGGYNLVDYGQGITVNDLVRTVIRDDVDILLISTLMLPAALRTKEAISRIKKEKPKTRVIVGGAPFNFDPALWKEVGADAMGHTASETLEIIKTMIREDRL